MYYTNLLQEKSTKNVLITMHSRQYECLPPPGLFLLILGKCHYFFSWEFSHKLSRVVKVIGEKVRKNSTTVIFIYSQRHYLSHEHKDFVFRS